MANRKANTQQALVIDQFAGGINTYSDTSSLADNELVDCVNFEVALDGSLVSRPPIESIDDGTDIDFSQRIYLIGSATISGTTYIFGANTDGTFYWSSGTWTEVSGDVIASSCVQYGNTVYFVYFATTSGESLGKWTPSGGYSNVSPSNLNTMLGTLKGAGRLIMYQDRMFIVTGGVGASGTSNLSRLIFSDPGAPDTFSATTQFVDVNPGDGQFLVDAAVQDDNLVLFKTESTYVFTFTSTPADAELIQIHPYIGSPGLRCVVDYENALYVFHRGKVYELVNYNFQCINIKVPFVLDDSAPTGETRLDHTALSRIGDRLILRWFNRCYVYGLRTKTWTRWVSSDDSLNNVAHYVRYLSGEDEYYLAGSTITSDTHLFKLTDGFDSSTTESIDGDDVVMDCSIVTKNFNINDAFHFKRLNWWGVDALTKSDITGSVSTVVPLHEPSWGDIMDAGITWATFGMWGHSSSTTLAEHTIEVTSTNILRSYFRFPRSLRFRQAHFEVAMSTDGTTLTGPIRIFGITLVNSSKELVPKGIN